MLQWLSSIGPWHPGVGAVMEGGISVPLSSLSPSATLLM